MFLNFIFLGKISCSNIYHDKFNYISTMSCTVNICHSPTVEIFNLIITVNYIVGCFVSIFQPN